MRLVILMEWNSKTPLEWDLENMGLYGSKAFEVATRYSHKIDEAKESKQMYESGVGSGSGFGHGSTSQNSFSASENSSAKEGLKSWTTVDVFPKDISMKEEFSGVDNSGGFPCLTSGAPMTGLKLGRRTYSKDMSSCSTDKSTSYSLDSSSSCPRTKRTRQSHHSMQTQRCQVEGCNLDLVSAKGYHRRHKICENHSKSPKVIVAGMERRFCQQCSRFHDLSEFDDKKRSCRRRLSDHNARRRRPQPEATQFNSTQLYDQRPRMNFLPNRVAIPVANQTWGTDCLFRGTLASNSWISPKNVSSSDEVIAPRTLYNDESAFTSNLDVASGFRHAPSLLSSNSWASNQHEPASLQQLMNGTHIALAQPLTRSSMQTWAVNSMEYVQAQVEQTLSATDKHLQNFNSNGNTQLQHHDSLNTTHESDFFYSNRIN